VHLSQWAATRVQNRGMVSCSNCGTVVSEWAACCRQCRSSLETAAPVPDSPYFLLEDEPGAKMSRLAEHSKRRGGRILLAVVLLVGLAAAGSAALISRQNSKDHTLAPPEFRWYTVITTESNGVHVVPLDGARTSTPTPAASGAPLETSSGLVFLSRGGAYILSRPFTGSPRRLSDADGVFPMIWPGTVGVIRDHGAGVASASYINLVQCPTNAARFKQPPVEGRLFRVAPSR
jgi:hypothetical protein